MTYRKGLKIVVKNEQRRKIYTANSKDANCKCMEDKECRMGKHKESLSNYHENSLNVLESNDARSDVDTNNFDKV